MKATKAGFQSFPRLPFLLFFLTQALFLTAPGLAATTNSQYVAGEILVELKPGLSAGERERVSSANGKAHPFHFRADLLRIKIPSGLSVEEALARIKNDPAVLLAQPNYLYHLFQACTVPTAASDAYYTSGVVPAVPCNVITGNGNVNWPYLLINAPAAWALAGSSLSCPAANPVTVAVLDTGVASSYLQTNHPDLPSSLFIPGYNSSGDWGGDTTNTIDNHGHGTYVTGILAAQWNNGGVANACLTGTVPPGNFNGGAVGVAGYPGMVKIMPVKVANSTGANTTGTLMEGIYFAALNGAQVLNMSLGTAVPDPLEGQAVTFALNHGCVLVAAVGNSGNGVPVSYPAGFPGVLAVGAVGPADSIPGYTQTGPGMGMMAPGGANVALPNTLDTADNFFGCMLNCPSPTVDPAFIIDPCDNNYGEASGTSAASPVVAGAAAFLLAMNPTLQAPQVVQILESTAHQILGSPGTYNTTTGWGRLDLNAAVLSAVGMGAQTPYTATPTPVPPTATATPAACGGTVPGSTWALNTSFDFRSDDGAVFDQGNGNGPGPFLLGGAAPTNPVTVYYYQAGIWKAFGSSQAPLLNRSKFNVVAFNGKLWVLGGLISGTTYKNDTWYSLDGLHYLLGTSNAGFAGRSEFSSVVFQNNLWVLAGLTSLGSTNDAWTSPDGSTWTLAATPPFSARMGQTATVFNGRLWVIGGQTAAGFSNEIWSTGDGTTWVPSVPTGSFFSPRWNHLAVACGNTLWVMGGSGAAGQDTDLWVTTDGINWAQSLTTLPFGTVNRYSQVSLSFQGQVWSTGLSGLYTSNCCDLPTLTPTATNSPTNSPTSSPTVTPTSTPSFTPTPSPTPSPASTPTDSPTITATWTASQTPTSSPTLTPTSSPTLTPTSTLSNSPTITFSPTITATPPVTTIVIGPPYPNPVFNQGPVYFDAQAPAGSNLTWDVFTTAYRKVTGGAQALSGKATLSWNLRDGWGGMVANGLYYLRVNVGGPQHKQLILKVIVMR